MINNHRDRNIVAAICYVPVISIVISLVILFVEKEDRFIRFHALQAFLFSLIYYLIVFFFGGLPFLGGLISGLIFVVAIIIWIYGIMSSFRGRIFKLPVVGNFSEKYIKRAS